MKATRYCCGHAHPTDTRGVWIESVCPACHAARCAQAQVQPIASAHGLGRLVKSDGVKPGGDGYLQVVPVASGITGIRTRRLQ